MDMEMPMYFEFSKSATVLFKAWKFDSTLGLVVSIIGVFILAFSCSALKYLRDYLRAKHTKRVTILSSAHIIQTLLQAFQVAIGYFLMAIVMTYNGWLSLAVIFGLVTGYFVAQR
ncbi:probable low affinity copper uptake protein 2 [Sitophilus oryzae]|uniref:Copper transport protein n=1 Tax=Sitophilus oryzae TaxID=7048 RepID=A0A6J2XQA7_SITOR|nr:probable low affinity copper uptake protein 2 [Sitophilus oryzae]